MTRNNAAIGHAFSKLWPIVSQKHWKRCGKTAMIPLIIFLRWIWQPWTVPSQNCMWKICQKKTAGEKAPFQLCGWKICRWEGAKREGAIPTHPKTVDEACNWDWGPLEGQFEFLSLRTPFYVWMLHGSTSPLSGRSPFRQLQIKWKCRQSIGCLVPNKATRQKLHEYAGVYALPTVWPDVSMLGANNV